MKTVIENDDDVEEGKGLAQSHLGQLPRHVVRQENQLHCVHKYIIDTTKFRAVKCHRYDGYIRVKILPGWGEKFVRTHNFVIPSHLWKIC